MRAVLFLAFTTVGVFAQTAPQSCAVISPAAAKFEFDAASIKPSTPLQPGQRIPALSGGPGAKDPGRITAPRISLSALISLAYALMSDQITGPDWMGNVIENGFAITATMPPETTKEEYCGMLRNLITSRFHLTFHRQTQPRPGYELVVLAGGPKFKTYNPDVTGTDPAFGVNTDARGFAVLPFNSPTANIMGFSPTGVMRLSFRNTMDLFAVELAKDINRSNGANRADAPLARIADKTGMAGTWDIHLEFAGTMGAVSPPATDGPSADLTPDVFSAVQQQLGLRLQKVKDASVEVLIVDHADQSPTDN